MVEELTGDQDTPGHRVEGLAVRSQVQRAEEDGQLGRVVGR